MDALRFDLVTRNLAGTRRGMLRRATTLPLAAFLAAVFGDESKADERQRRRNLQQRRGQRHEQVQDERKKKKKKKKKKGKGTPPPGSPPPPSPPCTVCATGCAFNSVQAAINAASAGATITL